MSSVCDLGTIRSIIRGVDQPPPYMLISEMIDDAEHSNSSRVFVDINTHDSCVVFGFENAATAEQLNNMVQWNPTSEIHNTSNISTCGQGLKYYEFRFRGQHIHATKEWNAELNKFVYRQSSLNSDIIYDSAISKDVSESEFSEVLKKNTSYAVESDETVLTLERIFSNEGDKYPFEPKTIILSKRITNKKLLDDLIDTNNIEILEKELNNKYYEEITKGLLNVYIKFPLDSSFRKLEENCKGDVIGSTKKQSPHETDLYYIMEDISQGKKGEYLFSINNKFFKIQKNGSGFCRTHVTLSPKDMDKLLLQFQFIQYTISKADESSVKKQMVGTAMEAYCGIYMKIGNKFINSKPMPSGITERNVKGSKLYRGILNLMNPEKTKMMLEIHGLKPEFNLSGMAVLEKVVKQCCHIYKIYCKKYEGTPYSTVDPVSYCIVNTSNKKSKRTSLPGHMYLRKVGNNFYKLGMTASKNRAKRIFDRLTIEESEQLDKDFPEEEIYPFSKQYYELLTPEFNSCSSTEQALKEFIAEHPDVQCYDTKKGNGIREYFHCDDASTLQEIKQFMIDALDD